MYYFVAKKECFITSRQGIIFGRLNLLTRRPINILQMFMARTLAQYGYKSPRMVYFWETDSPFVYHFLSYLAMENRTEKLEKEEECE